MNEITSSGVPGSVVPVSAVSRNRGTMWHMPSNDANEHDQPGRIGLASADSDEWAGRRSDARRNHDRVLAAAMEVFTEHGLEASIPQVAARAGVGRATVYRSYPTRADLVRALAQVHIDWINAVIEEAAVAAKLDAFDALQAVLEKIFARLAEDRLMLDVLTGTEGIAADAIKEALMEQILLRARDQGRLRADVTLVDLQVLVTGCARALIDMGFRDGEVWRRYATLALGALRPWPEAER